MASSVWVRVAEMGLPWRGWLIFAWWTAGIYGYNVQRLGKSTSIFDAWVTDLDVGFGSSAVGFLLPWDRETMVECNYHRRATIKTDVI